MTTSEKEETALCPHCLAPVDRFDHFCPRCGGPVTAHASVDPIGQIHSAGRAYHLAATGRPKLVVTIGIWLIFGPQAVMILMSIILVLRSLLVAPQPVIIGNFTFSTPPAERPHLDLMALLWLVLETALLVLYIAILWKITVRHYRGAIDEDDLVSVAGNDAPIPLGYHGPTRRENPPLYGKHRTYHGGAIGGCIGLVVGAIAAVMRHGSAAEPLWWPVYAAMGLIPGALVGATVGVLVQLVSIFWPEK